MILLAQRTIFRPCWINVIVAALSVYGTIQPSFAESNVFSQDPVSAALAEQSQAMKREAITGYAATMVMKFEAISRYYSFPVNFLLASAAEIDGSEEDKLDHAIAMAEALSLGYLSGEEIEVLLTDYFQSSEKSKRVLERAYVIAETLYPEKE